MLVFAREFVSFKTCLDKNFFLGRHSYKFFFKDIFHVYFDC